MTVIATWDGVAIDPDTMTGRGYLTNVTVRGVDMPRYFGYMQAAIYQAGTTGGAAATSLVATSTTSRTIATGSLAFTLQAAKNFAAGQIIVAYVTASPAIYVSGTVTSYDAATGALVLNATSAFGSGTFAAWTVALSGPAGVAGPTGSGTTLAAATNGIVQTAAPRAQLNAIRSILAADDAANGRFNISLSGDVLTPGNSKMYGTNSAGVRGWYDPPSPVLSFLALGLI